jgi:hypothetical protein
MAATEGNQFWRIRSKHGRDALFATPELLLESAHDYFKWCDDNPWVSSKSVKTERGFINEEKPTQRPYSKGGWYIFIRCSDSWLKNFKKACHKDFLPVIEDIENCIATQQWEGATTGAFNANIIARTLGLSESIDNKHDFPKGTIVINSKGEEPDVS